MRLLLFVLTLFSGAVHAVAVIDSSVFSVGRSWTWLYSELNKTTGVWSPYFQERYYVSERDGAKVTMLMQSAEFGKPLSDPHHKFVVDLTKCEKQAADPRLRTWTVTFYTRNLQAGAWTMVSSSHPNLVFTEKFNCSGLTQADTGVADSGEPVFQFPPRKGQDSTWYFDNGAGHPAVSARKLFAPNYDYKAEFLRAD